MGFYSKNYQNPSIDAGLGLIFRLNMLWTKIDIAVESGDYHKWNRLLERVYCNISYRELMKVDKDTKGKITNVSVGEEDSKQYNWLSNQANIKLSELKKINRKLSPRAYHLKSFELYKCIEKKDLWLRKKMFQLKLYLKETENDPRRAIYGG